MMAESYDHAADAAAMILAGRTGDAMNNITGRSGKNNRKGTDYEGITGSACRTGGLSGYTKRAG